MADVGNNRYSKNLRLVYDFLEHCDAENIDSTIRSYYYRNLRKLARMADFGFAEAKRQDLMRVFRGSNRNAREVQRMRSATRKFFMWLRGTKNN